MNRRVFKTFVGQKEVEFEWVGLHNARYLPTASEGWREIPDGREHVTYHPERGWLTDDELEQIQKAGSRTGS